MPGCGAAASGRARGPPWKGVLGEALRAHFVPALRTPRPRSSRHHVDGAVCGPGRGARWQRAEPTVHGDFVRPVCRGTGSVGGVGAGAEMARCLVAGRRGWLPPPEAHGGEAGRVSAPGSLTPTSPFQTLWKLYIKIQVYKM